MFIVRTVSHFFLDMIETMVIALSIFLVVYLFAVQPHQVNGQSMVPNFQSGEYLLSDKVSYRSRDPLRGEVVVFHAPPAADCPEGTGCDFIKRVIGLPGDTVEVKNNHFFVNNVQLSEDYIPESYKILPGNFTKNGPVTVPDGQFFVSGDNRPYSSDSRQWGPINKSNIVGRAFFRYWPPKVSGWINKAEYPNEKE